MIRIRFTKDRGNRKAGDIWLYDEVSAAAVIDEGSAEFADAPPEQAPEVQPDGAE